MKPLNPVACARLFRDYVYVIAASNGYEIAAFRNYHDAVRAMQVEMCDDVGHAYSVPRIVKKSARHTPPRRCWEYGEDLLAERDEIERERRC